MFEESECAGLWMCRAVDEELRSGTDLKNIFVWLNRCHLCSKQMQFYDLNLGILLYELPPGEELELVTIYKECQYLYREGQGGITVALSTMHYFKNAKV